MCLRGPYIFEFLLKQQNTDTDVWLISKMKKNKKEIICIDLRFDLFFWSLSSLVSLFGPFSLRSLTLNIPSSCWCREILLFEPRINGSFVVTWTDCVVVFVYFFVINPVVFIHRCQSFKFFEIFARFNHGLG